MKLLILSLSAAGLIFAADPAKPAVSEKVKLAYWKSAAEQNSISAQFQSSLTSAQKQMLERIEELGKSSRSALDKAKAECGKTDLVVDAAGDLACEEKKPAAAAKKE